MNNRTIVWLYGFSFLFVIMIMPLLLFAEEEKTISGKIKSYLEYPNKSLVQTAWEYYQSKDYDAALGYAQRCIALYDTAAKKLQSSLKTLVPKDRVNQYWQLNDVATAKFITGRIYTARNQPTQAKKIFSDVVQNYKSALAYDARGWYWSVADAARDALKALELGIDYGDSSSSFLTTKAWEMYNKEDYKSTLAYTEQCIMMYRDAAFWQQKSITRYPQKKHIPNYWALNDVGTCYYLSGMASLKLGQEEDAINYFTFVTKYLYFASCWDPQGWFWKVADAAKKELIKLKRR